MKAGQKVYTTFYARENQTGITVGDVKKSVYQEDGNLIEEEKINVVLDDNSTVMIVLNHLTEYSDNSELPEFFMLPIEKQVKIKADEESILKAAKTKYTAKIEFGGCGVESIVRMFTGSELEIHAYVEKMRAMLQPVGYTSISRSMSSAK